MLAPNPNSDWTINKCEQRGYLKEKSDLLHIVGLCMHNNSVSSAMNVNT